MTSLIGPLLVQQHLGGVGDHHRDGQHRQDEDDVIEGLPAERPVHQIGEQKPEHETADASSRWRRRASAPPPSRSADRSAPPGTGRSRRNRRPTRSRDRPSTGGTRNRAAAAAPASARSRNSAISGSEQRQLEAPHRALPRRPRAARRDGDIMRSEAPPRPCLDLRSAAGRAAGPPGRSVDASARSRRDGRASASPPCSSPGLSSACCGRCGR